MTLTLDLTAKIALAESLLKPDAGLDQLATNLDLLDMGTLSPIVRGFAKGIHSQLSKWQEIDSRASRIAYKGRTFVEFMQWVDSQPLATATESPKPEPTKAEPKPQLHAMGEEPYRIRKYTANKTHWLGSSDGKQVWLDVYSHGINRVQVYLGRGELVSDLTVTPELLLSCAKAQFTESNHSAVINAEPRIRVNYELA